MIIKWTRPIVLAALACAALLSCTRQPTAAELLRSGDAELARQSFESYRRAVVAYDAALSRGPDARVRATIQAHLVDALGLVDPPRLNGELDRLVTFAEQTGDRETLLAARIDHTFVMTPSGEARVAALQALVAEAETAGARKAESLARHRLGVALIHGRQLADAVKVLERAVEVAHGAVDPKLELEIEHELAVAHHTLGDADRARPHFERAYAMAVAERAPMLEADVALDLGHFHLWLMADPALALVWFTRAFVGYEGLGLRLEDGGLQARGLMAQCQLRLKDEAAGVATLTAGLADARAAVRADPRRKSALLTALLALGPAFTKAGRGDEARAILDEAVPLGKELGDEHRYFTAVQGLAELAIVQKRWRDAQALTGALLGYIMAKEISVTDERTRLTYGAVQRNLQGLLLMAYAGQGDWARAFGASERMRSRRLLAGLGTDVILDAQAAQALLDVDTVLVEYAFTSRRAFVLVVDPTSVIGLELAPRGEVSRVARAWYEQASAMVAPPGGLDAAARALGDAILAPIADKLHGKRLVIVPDLFLHTTAFASLPLPDGRPLAERFELVQVPSASVLAALRARHDRRPRPTRELAILADPIFDRLDVRLGGTAPPAAMLATRDVDLVRLPSTHDEAQAIAALVPPEEVFLAEGAAATRAAALGPEVAGARLVHFATHALLDTVDPEKGSLVFAQVDPRGEPIDGHLRVGDIEKMSLAAELVVLSACRTAIGKQFDGEGLVGLTRAFLRAGVPRVVSSLWQVDDAATAELMARFYGGLLGQGLSAPAALRRAQLEAAGRGRPARIWAGFVFHGDWR